MQRIALTGGIASGKSHVRAVFEALGVPTIDADVLARAAVAPGTPGFAAVTARFGSSILDRHGDLDRRKLGEIVFSDAAARHDLENIVHPAVVDAIEQWFASLDPAKHAFAIADIPLLFETGRDKDYDVVIVTACEPELQVRRLMARDGISDSDARQRIAAQLPIKDKAAKADHVIHTDGTVAETNRQVHSLYERLRGERPT